MSFAPSPFQQAVFDAIKDQEAGSLLIGAVAGSGKTTTIVQGLSMIPKSKSVLMLAFNKSIATELKDRVPNGIDVATFHSVGFRAWIAFCKGGSSRKVMMQNNKVWKLIDNWFGSDEDNEKYLYSGFIKRMVSLAKSAGIGTELLADTEENWMQLAYHHDINLQDPRAKLAKGLEISSCILADSRYDKYTVDFDDMLYMPLVYGAAFKRYDYVIIDEAQDTNGPQRLLLESMLKPEGRLIAVGDEKQAIYGFRGADSDAMNMIEENFDCTVLPLSITYRCPKAVVALAQEIVPEIQAFEHAPEGKVEAMATYKASQFGIDDGILCRNVAPMVAMAYGFIRRGVGVQVLGREIGSGLINLVKKLVGKKIAGDDQIAFLETRLDEWEERELEKAKAKRQDSKADAIEDKAACLRVFIEFLSEGARTIDGLIQSIDSLFSTKKDGILTLCTIHKSKGLEWDRVFILDPWRMPSKWAKRPWMKVQEENIKYVAYTRAMKELYFIDGGCWDDSDGIDWKPVSKVIPSKEIVEVILPEPKKKRRKGGLKVF